MKKISVLIPCYNEEKSLPLLLHELDNVANQCNKYEWEYLFINDGSKDCTLKVLEQMRKENKRVNYIDLSRNYGKEAAMLAGFDFVTGDCTAIMDADLQHPPIVILEMLSKWEKGFDDVYARRITRGKESWLRKKLSLVYYKILNKSTRLEVLPNVGDFRLLDKQCINALRTMRECNRYTKGLFCYMGFKKTYVDFETKDRVAGESSMDYKVLFSLAIEGILSYTTAPLRLASIFGFLLSIGVFFYMLYVGIKTIISGDPVQGFPTLIITILLLGGFQLLSLGIIGEYLGRIFNESKRRPAYFIRTYNGNKI